MEALLQNNIRKIYIIGFFQSFLLVVPVFVPLLQGYGLSMTEVLQTQAVFAFMVAICEVPSGYLADLWGRKNVLFAGTWITALGYFTLPWANSFSDFVVFEILVGIGLSLSSGADLALLYDSQAELNQISASHSRNPGNHISRLVSLGTLAEAVAAILSSILLLWAMDKVVLAQALFGLVPAAFALGLVEPQRQISTASHRENLGRILHILRRGPIVGYTALAIIVSGLSSIYAFWMYQKYWQLQDVPVAHFGFIWAVFCVAASASAHHAQRLEKALGTRGTLLFVAALPLLGYIGMAFGHGWIGIAFGLAIMVNRGLSAVVFYDALNKRVSAEFRATINSLVSLGLRTIFIVTGPVLGYLVDNFGVRLTLLALAFCFAPVFALVLRLLYQDIGNEQTSQAQAARQADDNFKEAA